MLSMKYEEIIAKMNEKRRSAGGKSLLAVSHKWDYNKPYRMMIEDYREVDDARIELTFGIKVDKEFAEKALLFTTDGRGSYYWTNFIAEAFPNEPEGLTLDMIIGRPFVAEIKKNDRFDNIQVLSGYEGDYPDEVEGLC